MIQNEQSKEKIDLILNNNQTRKKFSNIETKKEVLETYLIKFSKEINENYSCLYILYSGEILFGDQLKKPISEIIKPQDKKNKKMILTVVKNEFIINKGEEIVIVLSIEGVKTEQLKGKKGEIIKDIIENSSLIKLDLKWYIFKHGENEIDLNQKFDNIANDNEKKDSRLPITVNCTIPLIVNIVNKNNEKYPIQCFLKDKFSEKISLYFKENKLDIKDYYLFYEKKKLMYYDYKKFYEIISEDVFKNCFSNEKINNTINTFLSTDNLEKTNTAMTNEKEKIKDIVIPVHPKNKTDEKKLEVEIKIIKKSCFNRYKRKICSRLNNFCGNNYCMIIFKVFMIVTGLSFFLTLIICSILVNRSLNDIKNN